MNDTTQPTIPIQPDGDHIKEQPIEKERDIREHQAFSKAYLGKKYAPEFLDSLRRALPSCYIGMAESERTGTGSGPLRSAWMINIAAVTLCNGGKLDDSTAGFIAEDVPEATELLAQLGAVFDNCLSSTIPRQPLKWPNNEISQ